jgi:hypothetical protein
MEQFKDYLARFLFILATMLVAMSIYYGIDSLIMSSPVLTPIGAPFKVDQNIVRPGEVVSYHIHYYKRLDIPGYLYKQLIIKNKKTGEESYLPLEGYAGHLPTGDVQKLAYAKIPEWAPTGEARIKITGAYLTGRPMKPMITYTKKFEVVK